MGVLKIYWRVMECQNYQKSKHLPDFAKIKIFILKGWFTIICKVHIVLFTETQNWVFILNYLWFHWVLKMGQTSKSQEIASWIPILWSPISPDQRFEIHISYINLKTWAEVVPEILKSNNLKIPQWFPGPSKFVLSRNF